MPSPVALASKEEEERRTWVTHHHEVVKLIKDCFGDRFSNNEIFDRLKISRRTGYRALGNDERIGKAPGRKPKIAETTIKEMIDYIENGGCNDVGNVWKHLAEKFAPDCNPKTVQDAVKKSGFKNYRSTVKLEPLLNEHIPDGQQGQDTDEHLQQIQQAQHAQQLAQEQHVQQQAQQQAQQQQQQQQLHTLQQNVIDPAFQQLAIPDNLRGAIETAPDAHVRYALYEICNRSQDAVQFASAILFPFMTQTPAPAQLPQLQASPQLPQQMPSIIPKTDPITGKRLRLAVCRRCNQQYDRAENTMDNRNCLYHKGSPQKIYPDDNATMEQSPEAFIWSCCAGNALVRGCCRAMHTTKKKRKYGKKRTAEEAGLDDENGDGEDNSEVEDGETTMMTTGDDDTTVNMTLNPEHSIVNSQLDGSSGDPNIDASLQDFAMAQQQAAHHHMAAAQAAAAQAAAQAAQQASEQSDIAAVQHQLSIQMAQLAAASGSQQAAMQGYAMAADHHGLPHGLHDPGMGQVVQHAGDLLPEMQLQLAAGLVTGTG